MNSNSNSFNLNFLLFVLRLKCLLFNAPRSRYMNEAEAANATVHARNHTSGTATIFTDAQAAIWRMTSGDPGPGQKHAIMTRNLSRPPAPGDQVSSSRVSFGDPRGQVRERRFPLPSSSDNVQTRLLGKEVGRIARLGEGEAQQDEEPQVPTSEKQKLDPTVARANNLFDV